MADPFTGDVRFTPYWWDGVPPPARFDGPLPAESDVVVIGSGYTGLQAALQTARGGRSTLVLDAEQAGFGCSSRNGGQISTSVKPSFAELVRRHGQDRAAAILGEGHRSLAWIGTFLADEGIDCEFRISGRFHAAHSAAQYEALVRQQAAEPKGFETGMELVSRERQRDELGSDSYFGGAVFPRHAALDPARYHRGLLDRALASGARVVDHCPATALVRDASGVVVTTPRGTVRARDVVVATNGYTGRLTPWLRRRVIPIGSYMIATEPLPAGLMDRLMPRDRVVSDTRKVVFYYRPSPDRTRILFGGRVSFGETDPRISGGRLHTEMVAIFPELRSVKVSHSWAGTVAYTFDELPHLGCHDGLHYAMGYCGSGVAMASHLGMRLGQQVLGLADGQTGFDGLTFQTRPFYAGNPWFLAPSVAYYRWRDRAA